jgi:hypothetical protein
MDTYELYDHLEKGRVPGAVKPYRQKIKSWLLSERLMEDAPEEAIKALNQVAYAIRGYIQDLELFSADAFRIVEEEKLHLSVILLRQYIESLNTSS